MRDTAETHSDAGLGFKRDDPTTWKADMMPADVRGGMLHSYGIGYEDWVWEAGAAPGVVEAYTKLWGTSELVKSIDTASIMMPGRLQPADIKRWPHADHAPARRGVYCIQGECSQRFEGGHRLKHGHPRSCQLE